MKTQIKYKPRVEKITKVWSLDAKLWVPHNDEERAFASPSFGPNAYREVGGEILSHGLEVSTGDYTASLLHSAYCDNSVANEPEFQNVREIMKSRCLWIFNRNLWTDKGVYVMQDENALGRSVQLSEEELEDRLSGGETILGVRFSKDREVRFAPKGSYVLRSQTPENLAKNGFVIASSDLEGAEKLGEVSSKFRSNPRVYGLDISEESAPELRVSAVVGYGGGLDFGGGDWDDGYGDSCAFGVL